MSQLARTIATREVPPQTLALYWLCQAGFAFKTTAEQTVFIDPYLSEVVERVVGFKRMMACPIRAEEVVADLVICTHEHLDHMDTDALPALALNPCTHFAGPIECVRAFEAMGVPSGRSHLLEEGKTITVGGTQISAVYADHGDLAPDALGVVLDFAGIRVYHTGDTAFRPAQFQPAIDMKPNILLPCINGAFGNMDWHEAALLTQLVSPQVVLPTHFWMFIEQNGDPKQFLSACSTMAPGVKPVVLSPGEEYLFHKAS